MVSFLFYLKLSLLNSLNAHKKKSSRPVLHEGIILLIEEYCRDNFVKFSLLARKRKRVIGKETLDNSSAKKIKNHNVKIEEISQKELETKSNSDSDSEEECVRKNQNKKTKGEDKMKGNQ